MSAAHGAEVREPPDGSRRRAPATDWLGWASCAVVAVGFGLFLLAWSAGGFSVSLPWAPSLDLRLSFSLDGLGALYALLATGVGALVFAYGSRYLKLHLEHEERPLSERWRFWPWMVLFAASMAGLALAQDLVLLFVFFDLTAICSYFLIGFDREQRDARTAAIASLIITVASAVAMLIAAVLFYGRYGTFSIPELVRLAESEPTTTAAAALLAVAALAKSAQVPLHFWLPRAMTAPTPVSAYLHSAAMVAAGVLVLGRVHPLLALSDAVLTLLLVVGTVSIVIGGVLALGQDRLKQVLAYSTISQYGYMVLMYGIGGPAGNGAAAFYVLVHGVAKSALFMTAGAVTTATGEDQLSRLGGLRRRMPVLAVASGVAAATLAALPLTSGFFKDELFFKAALEAGPWETVVALLAATLTFAYIGRFWGKLFLGRERVGDADTGVPGGAGGVRASPLLVAPVVVLAVIAVLTGLVVQPFAGLAEAAGNVSNVGGVHLSPAYHLDARPENLMALSAWALGGLLLVGRRTSARVSQWLAAVGERWGPRRSYAGSLRGLSTLSNLVHDREVRTLRNSIAVVLVPAALLVGLAFLTTPRQRAYVVGTVSGGDWLIVALLALVAIATVAVARSRARLPLVLTLAVVGFALAAVYAFFSEPDVALVAVTVETMITLVFLVALARLPRHRRESRGGPPSAPDREHIDPARQNLRNLVAGSAAGLGMFVALWSALSHPARAPYVATDLLALTPVAHGKDTVTVIVADFRGLDTLGEITVLVIAGVGVASLLRRGRLW
ncbi:hydrogen gas-evolving membrane-bound hydrogenase subunit E [Saccharomonospora cyanea]|uniref:NADH:ubiquinone oxidoreductase subunit 5 (Chain L)/multisubunit Na+/H+ antiporter, MnhA subunit n=1 Tax=Saccharomonospora cyanea NA-134 TaxID=882082 RepID=H5XIK4_9PSEU|nr:hydrogen gas-evolving membrane-bound hydrogenase subunit E [Saccharomonospora cyanea]EHR62865.1 NADH:ubiquinone oxidoreductase subunit 5 (chain L)/multisubunit Na+/H+ antiporter, MnhA subunit [Saccharomonospora cyanea NA-134]